MPAKSVRATPADGRHAATADLLFSSAFFLRERTYSRKTTFRHITHRRDDTARFAHAVIGDRNGTAAIIYISLRRCGRWMGINERVINFPDRIIIKRRRMRESVLGTAEGRE